ncbi:transcriptional repressor [Brevibacillus sp. SYSU BS000544]|uniref:transcriptional repressor n=1 Tax=Brevibacillus sp. SYSU BS000544 TaxID=3416443 RepID=UPI003CE4A89F
MTAIEIIELLKRHKLKHTEKRIGLLKIFRENERELQIHEVIFEMRKQFPCVSQQTILGNLEIFVDAGLLVKHKINSEITFSMSTEKVS